MLTDDRLTRHHQLQGQLEAFLAAVRAYRTRLRANSRYATDASECAAEWHELRRQFESLQHEFQVLQSSAERNSAHG